MTEMWHKCLYRVVNALSFSRITVVSPERLPRNGPVLYLGLHCNGAVDGFVYHQALDHPVFLISTQLRRSWFARLFFHGIAVNRTKDDGDPAANDAAMRKCLELLRSGGKLFVFPEGTSGLGPRHLPFKSGGVWLALDYIASGGPPLQIIPVGIHYECPWAFSSKVEVVVGPAISSDLPVSASRLDRIKEMKRRVQTALEAVGINVVSEEYQETIQRLAYGATLATPRSYFKSLKVLEKAIPQPVLSASKELEPAMQTRRLLFHQGVPLFPTGSTVLYALALVVMAPIVLSAILVNLPPFLTGWYAGKKFPDDRNVILLWKILAGVPVLILWALLVATITLVTGRPVLLAAYALLTWLGVLLYYRVKKLTVAVYNGFRYPKLQAGMLAFRETLLRALPHEGA